MVGHRCLCRVSSTQISFCPLLGRVTMASGFAGQQRGQLVSVLAKSNFDSFEVAAKRLASCACGRLFAYCVEYVVCKSSKSFPRTGYVVLSWCLIRAHFTLPLGKSPLLVSELACLSALHSCFSSIFFCYEHLCVLGVRISRLKYLTVL